MNVLKGTLLVPIKMERKTEGKTLKTLPVPSVQVSKTFPHGFISEERKFSVNHHQGQRTLAFHHFAQVINYQTQNIATKQKPIIVL